MDRPQLPTSFVKAHRRQRLMRGVADAIVAGGYRETTVADITSAAACARNTFYELFRSKEDALRATLEWIVERVLVEVEESGDAVGAVVDFVHANPTDARLALVEAQSGAPDLYEENLQAVARQLGLGDVVGRMVAGGVAAILYRATVNEESVDVDALRAFVAPHFAVDAVAA